MMQFFKIITWVFKNHRFLKFLKLQNHRLTVFSEHFENFFNFRMPEHEAFENRRFLLLKEIVDFLNSEIENFACVKHIVFDSLRAQIFDHSHVSSLTSKFQFLLYMQ